MRIDVYVHDETHEAEKLDLILKKLDQIQHKEDLMAADLQPLTDQVAANTTVIGSAITLINGFAALLAAAGTDPVKLADLQNQLKAQDDTLAAAVAANTPAA